MCGIAGIIAPLTSKVNKDVLQQMSTSLIHRGPDGEGYWFNEDHTVGFAHRRLAINEQLSFSNNRHQYYQDLRHSLVGEHCSTPF